MTRAPSPRMRTASDATRSLGVAWRGAVGYGLRWWSGRSPGERVRGRGTMRAFDLRPGRLVLAVAVAALAGALFASGAGAAKVRIKVKHVWLSAPVAPGTPSSFSAP